MTATGQRRDAVAMAMARLAVTWLDPVPSCGHVFDDRAGAHWCVRHPTTGVVCQDGAFAHDGTHHLSYCDACGRTQLDVEPRAIPVVARDVYLDHERASGEGVFGGQVILTRVCVSSVRR